MKKLHIGSDYQLQIPEAVAQRAGIPCGGEIHLLPCADGLLIQSARKLEKYQILCLGSFAFLQSRRRVSFSCKKLQELLAFLACESRPVSKQHIAMNLWPDSGSERAMDSLYKLCRAAHDLEHKGMFLPILITRGEIGLDFTKVQCDLERFEELYETGTIEAFVKAAALYRGPLLLENAYEWSADFEGRYDMHYLDILDRLAAHYKRLGNKKLARHYEDLAGGD